MIKFAAKLSILILVFALSLSTNAMASEECTRWFERAGLSHQSKDCEIECSASPVDMESFSCPSECERLCHRKPRKECPTFKEWQLFLKNGSPPDWPVKRNSGWSERPKEKEAVFNSLEKLPPTFRSKGLKGIYLMGKNPNPLNPGNPASTIDSAILIFDRAFTEPKRLSRVLVHELVHVLTEHEMQNDFESYKKAMGWKGDSRPGSFIDQAAKSSPEEDFALNIEAYIFENKTLKDINPNAHAWIEKKMKLKFPIVRECLNAN